MRWLWIDRFVEFERGKRASAIKNVALTEPQLDGYLPGNPLMPAPLIIEGLAQTAGLLAGEMSGFRSRVVLAKISKAVFHFHAVPGDTLHYSAVLQDVQPDGAIAIATSKIGDRVQADVEFMFAFLTGDKFANQQLFDPADLLRMVRTFGLYEVGRDEQGNPLEVPDYMVEAEARSLASYAQARSGS